MDAADDPFAPGAGSPPPQLAGRDEVLEAARVALTRIVNGTPDRGHLLLGLRGVGKTVLLNRIEALAEDTGYLPVKFEASEDGRLVEMLAPRLRAALVKLRRVDRAKDLASQGLTMLRNFASAFKVSLGGVDVQVERDEGGADTGELELDLPDLFLPVGRAAQAADAGVVILIDELQYLKSRELSALLRAMHEVTQKNLPVVLFGAGLPQLAGLAGDAKSYAERLFRYPKIDRLDDRAAREAIEEPLRVRDVEITDKAVAGIIQATEGYPYFLQEWGSHAWKAADDSPITAEDIEAASEDALLQLDNDFFRVRFDRLTPRERDYMRAMAELGPGPHQSGDIARMLGSTTSGVGPLRASVIEKGMAYSPQYGMTAFTVPMFHSFMRREMPDWKPEEEG